MPTHPQETAPELTPAALREWIHHVESVMRGLAHSMNNRAAALSAVLELSREPDDDPAATRQILEDEMTRVQQLVRNMRTIGAPRDSVEALSPAELIPELQEVLALHADLRDRTVRIEAGAAPPVRVERWKLVRAILTLAASIPPNSGQRTMTVLLEGDGDWLVVRCPGEKPRSTYAVEVARAMAGEPLPDGSGFRIPTLEAIRRREGR